MVLIELDVLEMEMDPGFYVCSGPWGHSLVLVVWLGKWRGYG